MADLKPVLVVLPQGFADWETPMISAAGSDFYGLRVSHATPGGGRVTSIGGLTVDLPDFAPEGDEVIVLCGSDIWARPEAPQIEATLQDAASRGQTIAAICGGTLALARAGLVDARAHTSNSADFIERAQGYKGAAHYRDVPHAVADGGVITAPGTAPISFAAEVLTAAGVSAEDVDQFRTMLGAEHRA
ncbi:thiamine biosynthesis protein ThiJ [Paracoccus suum]|uniref:Thiamine biosynthesis protein ThiJ n=1 Tax=Paracoccus suum TaxID=2259340 RepID=A0A344PM57_9RHOB|nr:DJ-1/PfpI family protein [Paracoccus suum]AXC50462.1 thiamine biosynthesis protein ThiJ [Paracoccus suum]